MKSDICFGNVQKLYLELPLRARTLWWNIVSKWSHLSVGANISGIYQMASTRSIDPPKFQFYDCKQQIKACCDL